MAKENYLGLEAYHPKEGPKNRLAFKTENGIDIGYVDCKDDGHGHYELDKEDLTTGAKGIGHSPQALASMAKESAKIAVKDPAKFAKDDGSMDFEVNHEANKAANIMVEPDGGERIDSKVQIKFSDLTKRLRRLNKRYEH